MKRWIVPLLQLLVTAGLLAWFFHDPEFRKNAVNVILKADPQWLVIGILVAGVENLIGVLRWRIFLKMLGIQLSFWKSVQICLVALFCNTFMLGAVGGDLVRVAYLIRRGNRKTLSLLSVLMDRMSGLGALIFITLTLTWWNYDWLMQSPKVAKLINIVIIYQLACAVLIALSLVIAAHGWSNKLPKWVPMRNFVNDFGSSYSLLTVHWRSSLAAAGLSFFMLTGFFAVFYCSARAFGAPISFIEMCSIMPSADVIAALPISVGGLGVRESVFVLLLGQLAQIPGPTAVSISLGGYLMNNSWGLVGAALLPLYRGIIHDARHTTPR